MRFQCLSCGGSYIDVSDDGYVYTHACPPERRDAAGKLVANPERRDENVAINRARRVAGIKAEGAGVKCLTNTAIAEPEWITKLKAEVAKREEDDNG